MGVKVRKRNAKWYVVIDYRGRRKSKCVGTREAAERVKREIEARLALGDVGIFGKPEGQTFREYATQWLQTYVRANCKLSTALGYEQVLRTHLLPRFGSTTIEQVTREQLKSFLSELVTSGRFGRGTLKNILATLRAVLSHAVEDGLLKNNPAMRLGRWVGIGMREGRKSEFLTREEVERFLEVAKGFCPERYPLFLAGLRTGMRLGELLALEWGDVQLGQSEDDPNRHILVQHNFTRGEFTTTKSKKVRRVDLSRELRRVLLELRDQLELQAFARGEPEIPRLVFPSNTGGPLDGRNVYHRDFLPCLGAAGLRRVTFHALRHTYASLLIQGGASLAYVKEQLGHSSIQVTVDIYGHLLPGANIAWVDQLDMGTSPRQSATEPQPISTPEKCGTNQSAEALDVSRLGGRRGGTRTPDPRIRNPMLYPAELHARVDALQCERVTIIASVVALGVR